MSVEVKFFDCYVCKILSLQGSFVNLMFDLFLQQTSSYDI